MSILRINFVVLTLVGATSWFAMGFHFSRTTSLPGPALARRSSLLWFAKSRSNGDDGISPASNATMVTKEMFLRELLKDPSDDEADENAPPTVKVRRKNKKGNKRAYKVLDNRDQLPFAVTVATPDPYTHPEKKRQAAREQSAKSKTPRKRHDAVENGISSSLYVDPAMGNTGGKNKKKSKDKSSNVDTTTWLGDFVLDKHTTTGDLLRVGDQEYKVVRHKCQYKYAGGQRFVMVRKILQVKEVGRLRTEEYLSAQFKNKKGTSSSFPREEG